MSESNDTPKAMDTPTVMKRIVLPPRQRSPISLSKPAAPVPVPTETPPKLRTARPPLAIPPVVSPTPPQEKSAFASPPPGIAPISGIPQPSSFSSPVQEKEKIEDVAELKKAEFTAPQAPRQFTISDSHFEEHGVSSIRRVSPIPVYLSLAASLIALGIQIWMLLSAQSVGQ